MKIVFKRDGLSGGYIAYFPDIHGMCGQGETMQEAEDDLYYIWAKVKENGWLDDMEEIHEVRFA